MPSGDRTGPVGQGSRTGRALGFCSGYDSPGYAKGFGGGMGRGFRFGRNRGYGRGRGRGVGWGAEQGWTYSGFNQSFPWQHAVSKEDEIKMLKLQAEELNRTQKEIEKRITELELKNK
jgi:hypothetical protein